MKCDPYPDISDDLKAHALSITIGRYRTTPALLSRLTLNDFLTILAVIIECETKKMVARDREALPEPAQICDGPILASQLIARWKGDPSLRERFASFADYAAAVDDVLLGERAFDNQLLP